MRKKARMRLVLELKRQEPILRFGVNVSRIMINYVYNRIYILDGEVGGSLLSPRLKTRKTALVAEWGTTTCCEIIFLMLSKQSLFGSFLSLLTDYFSPYGHLLNSR